jgi:hypothetical protein
LYFEQMVASIKKMLHYCSCSKPGKIISDKWFLNIHIFSNIITTIRMNFVETKMEEPGIWRCLILACWQ